jgi:hypothetical protein
MSEEKGKVGYKYFIKAGNSYSRGGSVQFILNSLDKLFTTLTLESKNLKSLEIYISLKQGILTQGEDQYS